MDLVFCLFVQLIATAFFLRLVGWPWNGNRRRGVKEFETDSVYQPESRSGRAPVVLYRQPSAIKEACADDAGAVY